MMILWLISCQFNFTNLGLLHSLQRTAANDVSPGAAGSAPSSTDATADDFPATGGQKLAAGVCPAATIITWIYENTII